MVAPKKPASKPANREDAGGGGKFKPGQSGNPNGRPAKTEEQITLETMCREKTPQALSTILTIMSGGENERNRLSAAQFVIERGWGKAVQPSEITGKDGGPVQASITVTFVDPN